MWTIDDLLQGTKGEFLGARSRNHKVKGFSIDSRTIKKDALFIALSGPNFDGHDYVEQAFQGGAAGTVVSREAFGLRQKAWSSCKKGQFFILVDDPLQALQMLAKWHRKRFDLPLIAVTGSNGKTTTKEMIATILAQAGNVLKTEGNLNNHIGLPLSLLRLGEEHSSAVLEMGISGVGEMDLLCDIASPTVGLITNIGSAHLEGLGSLKGVAAEKSVLFERIAEDGLAVINRDDPHLKSWESRLPASWTFGLDSDADITAREVVQTEGKTSFTLQRNRMSDEIAGISLVLPGLHQLQNALAAATVTSALGVGLQEISKGLQDVEALPQRTEIIIKNGVKILFDAYNANPNSVYAALNLLAGMSSQGRRIALLGEMLELGEGSQAAHFDVGRKAALLGIDCLIALGPSAEAIVEGAQSGGMLKDAIFSASGTAELEVSMTKLVAEGDTLLMNASRDMHLEHLLEGF